MVNEFGKAHPWAFIWSRMIRVARLEASVYREVAEDRRGFIQALTVVVLAALALGVGAGVGLDQLIDTVVKWTVWWALSSSVVFAIGRTLFRTPETGASLTQLATTIGFAQSPVILSAFAFIPVVGATIFFGVIIWWFAATIVAVQQTLGYRSTLRALGVVTVGLIVVPVVILGPLIFG